MAANPVASGGELELPPGIRVDVLEIKTGEPQPSRHQRFKRVPHLEDAQVAAGGRLMINSSVLIGEAAVTRVAEALVKLERAIGLVEEPKTPRYDWRRPLSA
jgi:hypothetical protein